MSATLRVGDKMYIVAKGIPPIYQEVTEGGRHRVVTIASPEILLFRRSGEIVQYAESLETMAREGTVVDSDLYDKLKDIKTKQSKRKKTFQAR